MNIKSVTEEQIVRERYSNASREAEPALCCPIEYPRALLEIIPKEIIERDYGCGDPSPIWTRSTICFCCALCTCSC